MISLLLFSEFPLSAPRKINRLAEDARGLLRGMESHRVLRLDEIQVELRLALEVARGCELFIRLSRSLRRLDLPDEFHERIHRQVSQAKGTILNRFDSGL